MDLTFKTEMGVFNYRVAAVIINDNKLLAMKNKNTPYYYLPGGRVTLHESAENAIQRELKEELGINANTVKPLWFNQAFFMEDVSKEKFHELCIYFLVDVSDTELITKQQFFGQEKRNKEFFEWLDIDSLQNQYIYPMFIKERINRLPTQFELLTEYEY